MTTIMVVVGGRSAVRFMTRSVRLKKKMTSAAPSAADQAALGLEKSPTTTQTRPVRAVGSKEPRRSCANASDCDALRAGVALKEDLPGCVGRRGAVSPSGRVRRLGGVRPAVRECGVSALSDAFSDCPQVLVNAIT